MTVQELIDLAKDMLLEGSTDSFYSNATIVRYLNEAYRRYYNEVAERDPAGKWLAAEVTFNYTALASSVDLTAVVGLTNNPKKFHSLETGNTTDGYSKIPIIERRSVRTFESRYGTEQSYAYVLNNRMYLRPIPAVVTALTMFYTPSVTPMVVGSLAVTPPFVPDHYEIIAARAAVQMGISEKMPVAELDGRLRDLEDALYSSVTFDRQNQDQHEVNVEETWRFDFE